MEAKSLEIRKILATNSLPTIEVILKTDKTTVVASVPLGTSRSKYEVVFLPVEQAIQKFNLIRRYFRTQNFSSFEEVDKVLHMLDPSPDFKNIGGNVALGISSVFLKAFAAEEGKEVFEFLSHKKKPNLPKPICNVVGGWKGQSDVQEFCLLPVHQKTFAENVEKISRAYLEIGDELKKTDDEFNYGKNVESAWLTKFGIQEILEILTAVANENLIRVGVDFAASQLWDGKFYNYSHSKLRAHDQISFIEELARKFPVTYLEDPFHQDDFDSFSILAHHLQGKIVCGDDLYSTNLERLKAGIAHRATNAVIIKPSQIGTITDTIKVVEEAKRSGMKIVMSHRSGETDDNLICHLATGLEADFIKIGISGERTAKINELIRIEEKVR